MAELHAGDVLGGVRIEGVTGRGGMGIVYRGTELGLKRTVALKLVREDLAGNHEFRARFTRESEIAASLDHAHVIPIFAAGEDQGRLYVTMRYVDGTDLREEIKRRGGLDPYAAATIVSQIASALDAAHRRGLVHRDVKPANILLAESDGRPHAYLTDFGVSRAAESDGLTQAGAMIGTDDYMAPEQFENKGVDGRSDVYALGCVLYETLTGHVPFQRDSMAAKLYAHLRQPPPELPGHLPAGLNRVIARAMAKSPADRYATAGEMGRDLLDAVAAPGDSWAGRNTSRVALPTVQRPVPPPPHPGAPPIYAGSGPPSYPGGPPSYPGPQPLYASGPLARAPGPPGPQASGPPPQSGGGHRTLLIVALVAVVVVVVGSIGAWLLLRPDPAPVDPVNEAFGTVEGDPIRVGKDPNDIISAGGFMWTSNNGDGSVTKIDPATGDTEKVDVGGTPLQLAATRGSLWVLNYTDAVTHVDIDTGEVSQPIQAGPDPEIGGIAAADGEVWLSHTSTNTVTRIDANTMAVTGTPIPVGKAPGNLAVGDVYTFVVNSGDRSMTVLNRDGTVATTRTFENDPAGIEIVDGTIWVLGSNTVTPIDENTLVEGAPVQLQGAFAASAGDNGIFAAFPVDDELRWFDLKGEQSKGKPIPGQGKGVSELTFVDGTLWVTNGTRREVVRIKVP